MSWTYDSLQHMPLVQCLWTRPLTAVLSYTVTWDLAMQRRASIPPGVGQNTFAPLANMPQNYNPAFPFGTHPSIPEEYPPLHPLMKPPIPVVWPAPVVGLAGPMTGVPSVPVRALSGGADVNVNKRAAEGSPQTTPSKETRRVQLKKSRSISGGNLAPGVAGATDMVVELGRELEEGDGAVKVVGKGRVKSKGQVKGKRRAAVSLSDSEGEEGEDEGGMAARGHSRKWAPKNSKWSPRETLLVVKLRTKKVFPSPCVCV
jgi:hypothetical protein